MALKPLGNWMPDASHLADALAVAKNCYARKDHYAPFFAPSAVSQSVPDPVVAAISTTPINGVTEIYAGTADALYQLDGVSWTDVSGAAYLPDVPAGWAFVQYRNRVLAFSLNNLAQQKLIGTPGNFADVTDSPQARVAGVIGNFIMTGDIQDPVDGYVPNRLRWNAIDDSLSWPLPGTGTAVQFQADENDLRAESGVVTGIFGTNIGIIFQKYAVVRAEYVGSPLVFTFTEIDSSRGMAYRGAAAGAGRRVFYLSETGFFVTDGSGESVPIGDGQVDRWFYENLNATLGHQVRAAHLPAQRLIMWTFPSTASSTNDTAILYNYQEGRWTYVNINTAHALFGRTQAYTLDNIDSFGDLETIETGFDSSFWEGGNSLPMVFTAANKLATFSGPALNATLETNDVTYDGRRFHLDGVRALVEGAAATVSVGYRTLDTDTILWDGPRNRTPSTGVVDFRRSAHYHRYRFLVTGEFTKFTGFDALGTFDDGAR